MNQQISFSHRPQLGATIGVFVDRGVAYLGAAFVNSKDRYNRVIARKIVSQRIASTLAGKAPRFTVKKFKLDPDLDSKELIHRLRDMFKPDPEENDDTFSNTRKIAEDIEARVVMSRDEMWQKIVQQFDQATR